MTLFSPSDLADSHLVERATRGDRDCYGRLVERHQSAVCSVAYSVCGDFAASEDLGQEAFVAGWKQLSELRETQRFRAWVCGIVRQLALSYIRKRDRRDERAPAVDRIPEQPSPEPLPNELAVSAEEKALLWRALHRLPELYREPLVLFYREQQSIAAVAQALDLSEELVKQRLSRGRVLLRQEVTQVLTGILGATRPGVAFTLAVMGALPPLLVATGAAVTAGTAKAAATGTASSVSPGILFGSAAASVVSGLVGLLGIYVAYQLWRSPGVPASTRRILRRLAVASAGAMALFVVAVTWISGPGAEAMVRAGWSTPVVLAWLIFAFIAINATLSSVAALRLVRAQNRALESKDDRTLASPLPTPLTKRYQSRLQFLGLPVISVALGADLARGEARGVAKGWIAVGDVAFGGVAAVGTFACAPASLGTFALGLISVGGAAIGVLSLGALSLGWAAIGALVVAWKCAIGAWVMAHGLAIGGIAVAQTWAIGARAFAPHANDSAALAWLHNGSAVERLLRYLPYSGWISLLGVPGMIFTLRRLKRWPAATVEGPVGRGQ